MKQVRIIFKSIFKMFRNLLIGGIILYLTIPFLAYGRFTVIDPYIDQVIKPYVYDEMFPFAQETYFNVYTEVQRAYITNTD